MPNIIAAISNLEASVERPVILDIVRQVMNITQISDKTPIRFYGDEAKGAQKGSTFANEGGGNNRWNFDEKVVVEVDEDFERDRFLSTAVKEEDNQFIFRDHPLLVGIKPVYASSEITVTFRYRAKDKNQGNRWRNEIRARVSMMRGVNVHNVTYHYGIPIPCLEILGEIWRLRENIDGYGETFAKYFVDRLSSKASIVTNLNGESAAWAISETQGRIQGYFDWEGIPEKMEKDNPEGDAYVTSFTYKFHYDKPTHCNMQYPISIHQQLLSEEWRPKETMRPVTDILNVTYSASSLAFSKFESDRQMLEIKGNGGVDIPSYDEWLPGSIVPATLRVMTVLPVITPEDRRTLYSLYDLGADANLDADILEFIVKSEAPFMGRPYHSILCMSLYEQSFLRGADAVIITPEGIVKAAKDLSLRTIHHTRLSMVADLSLLTPEAIDRAKQWPTAITKITTAINAGLSDKGGQKDLGKNQLDDWTLCRLGLCYVNENPYVRSAITGDPSGQQKRQYIIQPCPECACCNGRDSLPIRKSKCYDGTLKRMNLVQTLFVASRPKSVMKEDWNNNVFGPTVR